MENLNILKRIEYISEKLKTLKLAIEEYDKKCDFFEKYKILKTIERDSEEIIESAVRINQELLSKKLEIGKTYRESFEKLKELGLFISDSDFLLKLANTTGFRNRLAHDYLNLDEKITIKSGKMILELYPKYLKVINKYLQIIFN